jgi:hypothetical protein
MKFGVGLNFEDSVIAEIFSNEEMTMEVFSENVSVKKLTAVLDDTRKFVFEITDTLTESEEYEFVLELPGKVGGYLPYNTTDVFTYSDIDQDYGNIDDIVLANRIITTQDLLQSKQTLTTLKQEVESISKSYKDELKYYENLMKYSLSSEMLVEVVTGREVTNITGADGLVERLYLLLNDTVLPAMNHYKDVSRQHYHKYKDLEFSLNQILKDFPEEIKDVETRQNG